MSAQASSVAESPKMESSAANSPATSAFADPGPLGLAGFALTTFLLSLFNANLVGDKALEAVVLPVALFYGGLAQLLAGMLEFRKGNTFGTLAFTSYGAFWLSFAAYVQFVAPKLPAADAHTATGLFLLAWAVFTAYMWLASLRTNGVVAAVFTALLLTFVLLAVGALGGNATIGHIGGWVGLLTAALAWYGSAAGVVNSAWKRAVLPVFAFGE